MNLDLNQVLVWLATGGSVVAVSWACENWGLFQSMTANGKRVAMWLSASVLGMGALAITTYAPPETLAMIAPFAKVMIADFAAIFLIELFHSKSKSYLY